MRGMLMYYTGRVQRVVLPNGILKEIEQDLGMKVSKMKTDTYMGENLRACMSMQRP